MNKLVYITILFLLSLPFYAQNVDVVKDLDADNVLDTVYLDHKESQIVCKLSTLNFEPIKSKIIEYLTSFSGVSKTKNGFELFTHVMRSGHTAQFRYERKEKRIRLIGISIYELGNAVHDYSGESSVNLLTNDYIGDWNYFDMTKDKLRKIPLIRTKMYFPKIYLEDFDHSVIDDYFDRSSKLYSKYKKNHQKKFKGLD